MTLLRPPITRWFGRSLGARLVALFLGLLAIVQLASFVALTSSLREQALRELPKRLEGAESVLLRQLQEHAQQRAEQVRQYGADHGFNSAVFDRDDETISSTLEENGRSRTGADQAAVFAPDFVKLGEFGTQLGRLGVTARRLAEEVDSEGYAYTLIVLDGQPHQLVLAPVRPPKGTLLGWLVMSFPLGPEVIADMRKLSSHDFTLLAREQANAAWRAPLSSLAPADADALARQAGALATGTMQTVRVGGEEFGVRTHPFDAVGSGEMLALVSTSIDAATRVPSKLQWSLLAITLGGFAAFALGSLYTARRVTTPLRDLSRAAERLGAGDYGTPLPAVRRADELGALAQSFENMRASIADHQAQISQLAYWDRLTGLPNRAQFREQAAAALEQAQQRGGSIAVIVLDLDRFKHVNDVLGYAFGDLLLKGVALRLTQQIVRDGDLVARLSGDEFALLLRDGDSALAEAVAGRIARAFDQPLTLGEHQVDIGASLGFACAPLHADAADLLLGRAEIAMYAAKGRGNGALAYDASFDAASARTLSLLSELRRAVERDELQLYLQPKLALASGAIAGAEVLLRWLHPTRGLLPPLQFVPFAEQTGFIRTLTLWVFEAAAKLWLALHAEGMLLKLSINLSMRDLLDVELPDRFAALLRSHRVPAEAFCLEITESAIMDDPQRALATLNRLSAMGFKLSIDDFGTGYSSLAYLKSLPVDELKIDKSFVTAMERDLDDAKIVRSTIDLAHNLGLSVVAEGVETAHAWELLRELKCDQAQGFHMGRPMPEGDFRRWCAAWTDKRRLLGAAGGTPVLH